MSAHKWVESPWPDDSEPWCKWCSLSKPVIGDDECVGPSFETTVLAPDEDVPVNYIELPNDFEPGTRVVVKRIYEDD